MKIIALSAVLFIVGCSGLSTGISKREFDNQWEQFKQQYRSDINGYQSQDEEQYRRSVFEDNYRKIVGHNLEAAQGVHTYTMGVNGFSDMTSAEFLNKYTSHLEPIDVQQLPMTVYNASVSVPDSHDWRSSGKVGHIKNQGQCGSCWAFASVAIIESRLAIKKGSLRTLSEQEIIDCTSGYDCQHGGNIQMATQTLNRLGGIEGDNDYPYISGSGGKGSCHYQAARRVAHVGTSLHSVSGEAAMQQSVYQNGPLYVHVYANADFQHYRSGIFSSGSCNAQINHAVTVVGYGPGYWIIKNSWATSWGEQGFMRMTRGHDMCRISSSPIWTDDVQ
ncbi:uncharacterized protein LOC128953285 [Oppia nitens]|uniref:uncharacterized protein LOC128953285 n=1 Tax=Oppia nitens TaxID=1686743 RepID=UPI0023DB9424|nr:uncharacterized protein LOC128953285 [Oppia nitens]